MSSLSAPVAAADALLGAALGAEADLLWIEPVPGTRAYAVSMERGGRALATARVDAGLGAVLIARLAYIANVDLTAARVTTGTVRLRGRARRRGVRGAARGLAAVAPAMTAGSGAIVCVDDESAVLAAVTRALRPLEREVLATSEPRLALDWIALRDVAVLIADYEMPDMNGVELVSAGRAVRPETVRMLLTGWRDLDAAIDGINRGEV